MRTNRLERRTSRSLAVILTLVLLFASLSLQPVNAVAKPGKTTGLKVSTRPMADRESGTASITIKWNKVSGASKYQLAYKTGDNAWTYKKTTAVKYKITGLNPYCEYKIKVRGLKGEKKGSWSTVLTAYTKPYSFDVDFPDLSNALTVKNRGLGSITVAWSFREPGDDEMIDYKRVKFDVYCSVDKENWILAGDKLGNKEREFTQRCCDMDTTYYFKVVPVDNTSYKTFTVTGEASNIVSAEVRKLDGLVIEKHYTQNNDEYIINRAFNLRGLMLHSVGGPIETSQEWYDLYNGSMKSTASVHGFIDGVTGALWQTLPWSVRAGHAGAEGNNRYIGIEMCESRWLNYSSDTDFTVEIGHLRDAQKVAMTTYEAAVKLFATLCDYYGLNPLKKGTIVSHYEWGTEYYDLSGGGHLDPEHMWKGLKTGYTMDGFRYDVSKLLSQYQVK